MTLALLLALLPSLGGGSGDQPRAPPPVFPAPPPGFQRFLGHCMSEQLCPPGAGCNCASPPWIIEFELCKPFPSACFSRAAAACRASANCTAFALSGYKGGSYQLFRGLKNDSAVPNGDWTSYAQLCDGPPAACRPTVPPSPPPPPPGPAPPPPGPPSISFECAWREAALNFSRRIQPGMGAANTAALLRSLNHSAFPPPPNDRGCLSGTALFDFETTEWALSPRQQLQAGPPTHPAVVGAAGDFHVAAGGYCSDSEPGTRSHPFCSIIRGVVACRTAPTRSSTRRQDGATNVAGRCTVSPEKFLSGCSLQRFFSAERHLSSNHRADR